jgi:hypothetical protein
MFFERGQMPRFHDVPRPDDPDSQFVFLRHDLTTNGHEYTRIGRNDDIVTPFVRLVSIRG